MKKLLAFVLACSCTFSLAACGDTKTEANTTKEETSTEVETNEDTKEVTEVTEDMAHADSNFEVEDGKLVALSEEGKELSWIEFPASVKSIDQQIFEKSNATKVTFESDEDLELINTFSFARNVSEVVLPSELSVVSTALFNQCNNLESIAIPANVTAIENDAFHNCEALNDVLFEGTSTEKVGIQAFSNCVALTSIDLPEGLETVSKWAFKGDEALTSVVFPDTLTMIGKEAFKGCTALTDVTFNSTEPVEVGEDLFEEGQNVTVHVIEGSDLDTNFNQYFGTDCTKELIQD